MKENEKCEYIMHEKERLYIICRRLEDDVCVKEDGMYASARMKIFLNFSLIFLFPRYYYESCQKRKKKNINLTFRFNHVNITREI